MGGGGFNYCCVRIISDSDEISIREGGKITVVYVLLVIVKGEVFRG